jgi:hypothetical protein
VEEEGLHLITERKQTQGTRDQVYPANSHYRDLLLSARLHLLNLPPLPKIAPLAGDPRAFGRHFIFKP